MPNGSIPRGTNSPSLSIFCERQEDDSEPRDSKGVSKMLNYEDSAEDESGSSPRYDVDITSYCAQEMLTPSYSVPNSTEATAPRRERPRISKKERKERRNTGQEYTTAKGKVVSSKRTKDLPACRMRCRQNLTFEQRNRMCEGLWAIGGYNRRVSYIASLIETREKATSRPRTSVDEDKRRNRLFTHSFSVDVGGQRVAVCKGCFMRVFDISSGFVTTCLQKKTGFAEGVTSLDARGKVRRSCKWTPDDMDTVRRHVLSSRRDPGLSINKMYEAYRETTENPVCKTIYKSVFREQSLPLEKR